MRRLAAWQVVAQKTDEWLNGTLDLLPRGTNAATLVSCVARQRFTHHVHERQIPGEEGRATVSAKYCLQATERFARAWNAGDKDDFMLPGSRGSIYRSADCVGGARILPHRVV
jgi:hypothetical protein